MVLMDSEKKKSTNPFLDTYNAPFSSRSRVSQSPHSKPSTNPFSPSYQPFSQHYSRSSPSTSSPQSTPSTSSTSKSLNSRNNTSASDHKSWFKTVWKKSGLEKLKKISSSTPHRSVSSPPPLPPRSSSKSTEKNLIDL